MSAVVVDAAAPSAVEDETGELLEIVPLGAGSEVGRSCVIAKFKGKTLMFDCGIHPGYAGIASLPYFDEVDLSEVDALLVTHFHLDHCAAVPFLVGRTDFMGESHRRAPGDDNMLMRDFVRLLKSSDGNDQLFTEKDLEASMKKIEVIDFHQEVDIDGVKVTPDRAAHVARRVHVQRGHRRVARVVHRGLFENCG